VLRRLCYLAAFALTAVLLLAGCGAATGGAGEKPSLTEAPKTGASTSSAPANSPASTPAASNNNSKDDPWTKKAGDLMVSLKIAPYPPQGRNPTTLDVTVIDSAGLPVTDAQVRLNLTMPAMPMPPNQPTAQPTGDGHYSASTRMGMRGEWQIAVQITRNGQQQKADFFAEVP